MAPLKEAAEAAAKTVGAAGSGALASLETLGGVLPESLPRSLRLFILVLLLAHMLALTLWISSVCREAGAGKKVR